MLRIFIALLCLLSLAQAQIVQVNPPLGLSSASSGFTCTAAGVCTIQSAPLSAITGLGTGVATALAINVGSAGAPVTFNGAGGTPSSITLTNGTGLPISGITGLGTGVATALAINVGSAGAPVTFNGAGGTPSSVTLTNGTGLPIAGISGLGTGMSTFLGLTYTAPTTWTVADSSGGTLALTCNGGGAGSCTNGLHYTRIGNMLFVSGNITYPSTADTHASQISGFPVAGVNLAESRTCNLSLTNSSSVTYMLMDQGATTARFFSNVGVNLQNNTLSGVSFYFLCIYSAT